MNVVIHKSGLFCGALALAMAAMLAAPVSAGVVGATLTGPGVAVPEGSVVGLVLDLLLTPTYPGEVIDSGSFTIFSGDGDSIGGVVFGGGTFESHPVAFLYEDDGVFVATASGTIITRAVLTQTGTSTFLTTSLSTGLATSISTGTASSVSTGTASSVSTGTASSVSTGTATSVATGTQLSTFLVPTFSTGTWCDGVVDPVFGECVGTVRTSTSNFTTTGSQTLTTSSTVTFGTSSTVTFVTSSTATFVTSDTVTFVTSSTVTFETSSTVTFGTDSTFTFTQETFDTTIISPAEIVTVLNVDPTITVLTANPNPACPNELITFYAEATDPGVLDVLTFNWDLDNDGFFDDYTGHTGTVSFNPPLGHGVFTIGVQVDDGDGGFDTAYITIEIIPEPSSLVIWSVLGMVGLGVIRRRRKA